MNTTTKGQAKTGRKGDPRMHRAVAARMENPELSLFEALRIGGFDYPADEDASIMDAEKVTLGQRKNQLSRRLRLARKQQEEQSNRNGNNNAGGGGSNGMMLMNHHHNDGAGGLNAKMKFQQLQQQQQFGGGGAASGGPGGGGGSSSAMSSEAQRQLEKLMQHSHHAKLSSGVKRNHAALGGTTTTGAHAELGPDAEIHPGDEEAAGLMDETKNARRMQAKFHPQYQPLFISRARSSFSSSGGSGGAGAGGTTTTSGSNSNSLSAHHQIGSSTTPQLGPLAAPLASLGAPSGLTLGGPSSSSTTTSAAANPSSLFQSTAPTGSAHPGSTTLGSITSTLAQSRTASATTTTTTPTASGVAIASLSSTAQSVGLTLEQLAVALSSSSNLVKVLSNNSGSEQQQELALRLFRNESRALYQRCMLLAGCRPEDAEEKSQNHLQFAFSAWQMEGKRLQELMGSSNDPSSGSGPAATNSSGSSSSMKLGVVGGSSNNAMMNHSMGAANQQQVGQEQHHRGGHSHGHAHSHSHSHNHDNHNANGGSSGNNNNSNNNGGGGSSSNNNNNGGQNNSHHEHSHSHSHSHDHGHDHGHVHQLEGKCGHKAIIHQPKDGTAHIDFLVGDKVECYHGVQPMGNTKSMGPVAWPSTTPHQGDPSGNNNDQQQQLCEDEHCELDLNNLTNNGNNDRAPKLLDISDLDLTGAEWNSDLNGSMGGTLLGLFKLGDADKDDAPSNGGGGSSNDGFGISV